MALHISNPLSLVNEPKQGAAIDGVEERRHCTGSITDLCRGCLCSAACCKLCVPLSALHCLHCSLSCLRAVAGEGWHHQQFPQLFPQTGEATLHKSLSSPLPARTRTQVVFRCWLAAHLLCTHISLSQWQWSFHILSNIYLHVNM